jgi:hypothetical protein
MLVVHWRRTVILNYFRTDFFRRVLALGFGYFGESCPVLNDIQVNLWVRPWHSHPFKYSIIRECASYILLSVGPQYSRLCCYVVFSYSWFGFRFLLNDFEGSWNLTSRNFIFWRIFEVNRLLGHIKFNLVYGSRIHAMIFDVLSKKISRLLILGNPAVLWFILICIKHWISSLWKSFDIEIFRFS